MHNQKLSIVIKNSQKIDDIYRLESKMNNYEKSIKTPPGVYEW